MKKYSGKGNRSIIVKKWIETEENKSKKYVPNTLLRKFELQN